ncbi:hypothetical protein E2C01_061629 [Portunus trituberculatus]|uniref:Uncharacterized protein n=1 Tax=Portunus trituberculatus TaxID=210409 RepID=A0A5B7HBH9_PORTR|nr:hypothetical protein [Portunus trituberculatus]
MFCSNLFGSVSVISRSRVPRERLITRDKCLALDQTAATPRAASEGKEWRAGLVEGAVRRRHITAGSILDSILKHPSA